MQMLIWNSVFFVFDDGFRCAQKQPVEISDMLFELMLPASKRHFYRAACNADAV